MINNIRKFTVQILSDQELKNIMELVRDKDFFLPPDLLFLVVNFGTVTTTTQNFEVNGELVDEFVNFKNQDDFVSFNKIVLGKYFSEYLVIATTHDPNTFILMGREKHNLNRIFIYNNATEDLPLQIADGLLDLFNNKLSPW